MSVSRQHITARIVTETRRQTHVAASRMSEFSPFATGRSDTKSQQQRSGADDRPGRVAKKPLVSTPPFSQVAGVNAVQLSEWVLYNLDDAASGGLTKLYEALREEFITSNDNGAEALHFDRLLQQVDAFVGVETATRQAAFIIGFECCRRLLLGEIDLQALKKSRAFKDGAK
jgi:hypothetical protein